MPSGLNMGILSMDSQPLGVSVKELQKTEPAKMLEGIKEAPPLSSTY